MSTSPIQVMQAKSNPSQRIIAAGIVLAFLYYASAVVITLLVSILFAYFLEPIVELLERFRVPRSVGALIVLLVVTSLVVTIGLVIWDKVDAFTKAWPEYSKVLSGVSEALDKRIKKIEDALKTLQPEDQKGRLVIQQEEPSMIRGLLLHGLGSLYTLLLVVSFVPFLVFFMLAAKQDIWHATMQLFPPTERTGVKEALEDLSGTLRGYIVGNLVVAAILSFASSVFFAIIGLDNPILLGITSGVMNLVPYIGTVMAWLPPIVVGLTKFGTNWAAYIGIALVITFFHLIAINVLIPKVVGKQVHLNALAVTVSLLFWGWFWGGMGLLLAIPITAAMKVVCDHVEEWQPVGRWLST
ncbi:MAG TPA: AI-2E family transporter [Candidatus Acidoferrales bacterium]|jgi:predicted PurR-regulated permease PerM|nr:AI-2E family transporter [Candidatus Acidoferrales bacterium]